MSSFAASSSSRHSSANVPSTKPGARNAAIGGRFSLVGFCTVRTFSHAYSIFIGPSVDAHLVRGEAEVLGDRVANAPDVLRGRIDSDAVVFPVTDRLVCLHGVVQHDLRAVFSLDDGVSLGDPTLEVAPLVGLDFRDEGL